MLVPKTAMDEDRDLVPGQDDVWLAWKVAAMKPEPVTEGVQQLSDRNLRAGVSGPDSRHQGTAYGVNLRGHEPLLPFPLLGFPEG
jgi:hypothetical protein